MTNKERLAQDIMVHDAEWVVDHLEKMRKDNSHTWSNYRTGMAAWLNETYRGAGDKLHGI